MEGLFPSSGLGLAIAGCDQADDDGDQANDESEADD